MSASRPEFENPPEVYYNEDEAKKYHVSTRVRHIQRQMTIRALELLNLPKEDNRILSSSSSPSTSSALLLDIGCGTGISGEVLTANGHAWIGVDISDAMLRIAKGNEQAGLREDAVPEEEELSGSNTRPNLAHVRWGLVMSSDDEEEEEDSVIADAEGPRGAPLMVETVHHDIGGGLPFRPGTFDGCVSISVLQWLCHSSKKGEVPQRRLRCFFQALYNSLRRGAKAVLQFYPSSPEQVEMVANAAMKCGFSGGVVVDFPHSNKAKKHYLVLQAGQVAGVFQPPPPLMGDDITEDVEENEESEEEYEEYEEVRTRARVAGRDREGVKRSRSHGPTSLKKRRRKDNRPVTGTKEWVLLKKEERRQRGEKTTMDSKYTMRKRKPRF